MEFGFIELTPMSVIFLFLVGFVGGLVSGFIGSGGAFVMTPAMMSMGVTAIMAVAANMAHKFPKALVGAMKRHKYGQVDIKLGIVLGISAEAGVLYGAGVQQGIKEAFGAAGSNLYVSVVFVVVLAIVGAFVTRDAWRMYHSDNPDKENITSLAKWVQSVNIPGTMMYFKSIDARVSVLFTIPIGFATGMLAATIAVGGFIGVPAMMYVLGVPGLIASATELVIAFVMGMGGSIKFAWSGLVDIRLAMIILAGSLFGIQLGAIGTTYVKPYMVKIVMGSIMILALLSRAIMIPVYLSDLGEIAPLQEATYNLLKDVSFAVLILALTVGAGIVFAALIKGMRSHHAKLMAENAPVATFSPPEATAAQTLSPVGRMQRVMLVTDGSEYTENAVREAIDIASRCKAELFAFTVLPTPFYGSTLGEPLHDQEKRQAVERLMRVREQAEAAGVNCEILLGHGDDAWAEIIEQAEQSAMDVIVMGRRDKGDVMRSLMGSTTEKVISRTHCDVLVVPRGAHSESKGSIVAVDGSRYSEAAADTALKMAQRCPMPITIVAVATDEAGIAEARHLAERIRVRMQDAPQPVELVVRVGEPDEVILTVTSDRQADMIVMGSHGRTGLDRLLLGSVSSKVIGQAVCPVLVVRL
ncbi:MAG: universal stress protein [Chromatiales bacterium]|nr:universal stress protein [Gammaproteobacteria bacterium]MBW6477126.1 universal stress protein [Chromatiales bacterium]